MSVCPWLFRSVDPAHRDDGEYHWVYDAPGELPEIRRLMPDRPRGRVVKLADLFFAVMFLLVVILAANDLARKWPPSTHPPAVILKIGCER